jgi:hypothetical protein
MAAPAHVTLTGLLDDQHTEALRRGVEETLEIHQAPNVAIPTARFGPAFTAFADRLHALTPVVRSELGLEHFVVGGVTATLSRHRSRERSDLRVAEEPPGRPRLGFVYTFGSSGDAGTGGTLRLLDDDWSEVEPADDTLVVFPADRHHEVTAWRAPAGAVRYSITGHITGASLAGEGIDLDRAGLERLQLHYLPRLSEHGYEIRPTPGPVHDLLTSVLEIRRTRAGTERPEPEIRPTGEADLVDVGDLGADLLRWLQPLHEAFAGVPLVPSNVYGIRSYRGGNTLEMHLDRSGALIVSSILQIDQDVDEPWPLVVELDGRRREIVLEPGQMLLYEGATTLHGRPSPLMGRSFANLFVHYRPAEWSWDVSRITRRALHDGLIDVFGRRIDDPQEHTS